MRRQALAQYFLVDEGVLNCIVEAADLSSENCVVEVGPGGGVLTRELVRKAGHVIAVELDSGLADSLASNLGDPPNLTVLKDDARTMDLGKFDVYKVVANLPYYAANPIIRRFLETENKPTKMVVTVQKEVAQSMVATPGQMGLLSVGVQIYGAPRIVCVVPPEAFRPSPRVQSAVVCIDVFDSPLVSVHDTNRFFHLVHAGFAAPRKQIHNSLAIGTKLSSDRTIEILKKAGIDPGRRSATLSLNEWSNLYMAYYKCSSD